MRASSIVHDSALFWDVASIMSELDGPWILFAGYELRHRATVAGTQWTICLKIHVVGEAPNGKRRRPGVQLESTVTLWPPKLTRIERARLTKLGWYENVRRVLGKQGYKGDWAHGRSGTWANFEKQIRSIAALRREATWLLGFQPGLLSPTDES